MTTDPVATHLTSLSDAELRALAVRVRVWLLRTEHCPSPLRSQCVRLLAAVHSAFGDRGWNDNSNGRNIKPGGAWDFVHQAARRTLANTPEVSAAAVLIEVSEFLRGLAALAA